MQSISKFIFELIFGTPEKQMRSFTRGACNAMVISVNSMMIFYEKKGLSMKYYSDYAAKALSIRPGWKEIDLNLFEFKNGMQLTINKEYSTADVSLLMILYEIEESIKPAKINDETLTIIIDEFRNKFKDFSEEKIDNLITTWNYKNANS